MFRVSAILLILVIAVVWIALTVGAGATIYRAPWLDIGNTFTIVLGVLSLWTAVVIPLIFIIFLCLRLFTNQHMAPRAWWTLSAVWLVSLGGLGVFGTHIMSAFNKSGSYEVQYSIPLSNDRILYLQEEPVAISEDASFQYPLKNKILSTSFDNVTVRIHSTNDSLPSYMTSIVSRGPTTQAAQEFAQATPMQIHLDEETLTYPSELLIPKGTPYRLQQATLHIYLPKGYRLAANNSQCVTLSSENDNTYNCLQAGDIIDIDDKTTQNQETLESL